jgi:DNA polymerase III subunit epsilon
MREFNSFDGFAVIDVETTGLDPDKGDRIIQIGIVRTDLEGRVTSTWSHYINPRRKVSASHIHHITDEMLESAPHFNEASEGVLHRIENRILVAHNWKFDGKFLATEFNRIGINFNPNLEPSFCTKDNAQDFITGLESNKLIDCANKLGIDSSLYGVAHDAEVDAMVAAAVLQEYIKKDKNKLVSKISNL